MAHIDFFFDIGSPYTYLAATQMAAFGTRTGASVRWRPFLLGGVFKAVGRTPDSPEKAQYMLTDLHRWADYYDVPFAFPAIFPANTVGAMRACVAADNAGVVVDFALALFKAYWAEGKDPSAPEVITAAAKEAGAPADLAEQVGRDEVKGALRATTEEAVKLGAFGAPTFVIDGDLYWGNDRLVLLEHKLKKG